MRRVVILANIFLVFLSCTSNTIYEKPKDLIPKDSMVLLLKDLYIATQAKNIKNRKAQRKMSYLPLIYKKYKIDSLRFQKSNFYYTSKIDDYEPMLQQVLKELESKRSELAKIKKVQDSILQDSVRKSRKNIELGKRLKNAIKTKKKVNNLKKSDLQ